MRDHRRRDGMPNVSNDQKRKAHIYKLTQAAGDASRSPAWRDRVRSQRQLLICLTGQLSSAVHARAPHHALDLRDLLRVVWEESHLRQTWDDIHPQPLAREYLAEEPERLGLSPVRIH